MEIIGYACALLVGISLGVLGSGGSILTVPILVYLLNVNPVEATGYSLFVVGFTSAIGCATYVRKKLVDMRVALIFAMPSIAFVFLTRRFLMPLIPDTVISLPSFTLSKAFAIMILYALLMVAAAVSMIFQPKDRSTKENPNRITNYPGLMAIGAVCGILTGIFGVGGGFIIIPGLVILAKVPFRMAVGTSLLIIAFNSLSGFLIEILTHDEQMDYRLLFFFSLLSIVGIFTGLRMTIKLYPSVIKRIFGWFILLIAAFVLINEIFITRPH